jgi:hypothetical protein
MKNRQIRPSSAVRLPIPVQVVVTDAPNATRAHHAPVGSPLTTPLKTRLYGCVLATFRRKKACFCKGGAGI